MRSRLIGLLISATMFASIGFATAPASASDTTSLGVSANVLADCKFASHTYTIPQLTLDTVGGNGSASQNVPITVNCNEGSNAVQAVQLAFNGGNNAGHGAGSNRAMFNGTNYLNYVLNLDNLGDDLAISSFANIPGSWGPTTANNVDTYTGPVYAQVLSSFTQIAGSGYTDTVVISVQP